MAEERFTYYEVNGTPKDLAVLCEVLIEQRVDFRYDWMTERIAFILDGLNWLNDVELANLVHKKRKSAKIIEHHSFPVSSGCLSKI